MEDIKQVFVFTHTDLRGLITTINKNAKGIALVVDDEHRLIDTITDGDVRRAILAGLGLDSSVQAVLSTKARVGNAVTASVDTPRDVLIAMMQERSILQIPLVNERRQVVDLVTLDRLLPSNTLPVQAVIMAGGFGKRLMPLTTDVPKPMLPVGDKPLLEHIVSHLRTAGIRHVNMTTHYLADKIVEHFQDGAQFGVDINYVNEVQPLGTAGALSLMEAPDVPLLVMNGDILTNVDYRSVVSYHNEHQADMTICVRQYDLQVPYGVVECSGTVVEKIVEKPVMTFFVNAGIYLLSPSIHQYIPRGEKYDMTDLVQRLLSEGRRVVSYPIIEYWLDIGQHADYTRAQEIIRSGKID